ncbi:hypothetical protein E8E12_011718 [Didymella heteroderae]|uniref:ADP-ribosylglycohydrolase n=1 Tax=Didymella heteroderae TaxID=1769908 RepID=A0A9P5C798_9PLEO|nr:hypothetical protein E8E12_011718 [Didymella heteroderae]
MAHSFGPEHPYRTAIAIDKIFGCIIGSALGDTIGLYTEFLSKIQCERRYYDRKFTLLDPRTEPFPDVHRLQFEPCGWTDDTDQALLIILAFLHNRTHKTEPYLVQDFAERLKIWVDRGLPALDRPAFDIGSNVGSVVRSAHFLRNPFNCATEHWMKGDRKAAPNGSLMRTHPIGVIGVNLTEEQTWRLSVGIGRTTHVDPRCVVACCISVGLIRQLLRGQVQTDKDMDAAIERAYEWVRKQPDIMNPGPSADMTESQVRNDLDRQEFEKHVYAQTLEELRLDDQTKMGYVYKCLGSAVLLLRRAIQAISNAPMAAGMVEKAQLFERLIVRLIMEGGDADTNGAAAGALLD